MASRPRSRGRTGRATRATGNAAQGVALLVSFVLMAGVGGVLAAGLALPAVALANGTTNITAQAFQDLPTDLNLTKLPQKSVILAADGTMLATFFDQNRVIVPIADIAPIMQKAVISVEDKRFYQHAGIDPQGMLRAFATGVFSNATQGASTLTQQYIKNVQLQAAQTIQDPVQRQAAMDAATVNTGSAGYARKLREAKLAITLEKRLGKDQILEAYLNIAQFGANSIYGVEAAAQYYFSVSAKDLNYLQAATIAGITQSPTRWDPVINPIESQGRRNVVLQTMHDQGYITDAEYQMGVATPIGTTLKLNKNTKQGCMVATDRVPGSGFFCDYVTSVIRNDPAFGATSQARSDLLYRGGLTITTTLIPSEQALAVKSVDDHVPANDPSGVGASIVTVEPGTGKITSMAQNRTYSALPSAQPGETSVNWNTTQAYGGSQGFPPGSTFKPFTLIEWLKQGHSLSETFDGTLRPLPFASFTACGAPYGKGTYKFGNSEGSGGVMNALTATKNSVNSAYLVMATQLDLCSIMQDAADLGVVQPSGSNHGKNIAALPGNVIGSDNVAPMSMAGAFAALAANGTFCQPIAITRVVEDSTGKDLPLPSANCQQKLEPRIASAATYALKNVWTGTAKSVGTPPYPAAGKTGTTDHNEDIWFVGYTPLRATAVWVGHPDSFSTMHGLTIDGHSYRSAGPYGADIPAPIWREFMDQLMAGQKVPDFAAAGNNEVYGVQVPVPNVVGMPQDQATTTLQAAKFQVKVSTTQATDPSPAGTVVSQSNTGNAPKNSVITLTLSNGQGAQPPPAPPQTQAPTQPGGPGGNPQCTPPQQPPGCHP